MAERPHKKLIVWQEGVTFVKLIYKITSAFPKEEQFGLTSQLRRASVSVPVNIAEGAARNSKKEMRQFLYVADGSLSEVDTLLVIAIDLKYITENDAKICIEKMDKLNALLKGLIRSINSSIT